MFPQILLQLEMGNGSVQPGCDSCNMSLGDVTCLLPTKTDTCPGGSQAEPEHQRADIPSGGARWKV